MNFFLISPKLQFQCFPSTRFCKKKIKDCYEGCCSLWLHNDSWVNRLSYNCVLIHDPIVTQLRDKQLLSYQDQRAKCKDDEFIAEITWNSFDFHSCLGGYGIVWLIVCEVKCGPLYNPLDTLPLQVNFIVERWGKSSSLVIHFYGNRYSLLSPKKTQRSRIFRVHKVNKAFHNATILITPAHTSLNCSTVL